MGALQWLGIFGFFSRLGLIVKGKKPLSNILSFIDHTVLGITTAVLISKIGDDSLFPDKEVKKRQKLPIMANAERLNGDPLNN